MAGKEEKDEQLKDKDEEKDKSSEDSEEDEGEEEKEKTEEELEAEEAAAKKEEDDAAAAAETAKKKDVGGDELASLRRTAREQKRQLDVLTVELAENKKALQKAGLVEEEDKEAAAKQKDAATARNAMLETLAEMMRLNPKYSADFDEVVTENFADDLMEGMARVLVTKDGISEKEATAKVEQMVWTLPNPYRFLYDSIKAHHPHFQKEKEDEGKKKDKPKEKEVDLKELLPKKAGSIQDAAGGEGDKGGWTAVRIDALDEDELPTVPKEIYQRYLRNELK